MLDKKIQLEALEHDTVVQQLNQLKKESSELADENLCLKQDLKHAKSEMKNHIEKQKEFYTQMILRLETKNLNDQ